VRGSLLGLPERTLISMHSNPSFVSPTDNLMTPCSQKINAAKKKHFTKFACSRPPVTLSSNELSLLQGRRQADAEALRPGRVIIIGQRARGRL
jgi:hypothetical protein